MSMNEIVMDNLDLYLKENDKGAFKYDSHTVWKRYSANQTLASIQRAIENSVGVDESFCKGIPVDSLQRMDKHLREAWRKLVLDELPTRPSSSTSDDSTPPSTPTEGRSPVMRVARMTNRPLFNPFPDEQDYVEFMLRTASTMTVGAFDPFEDQLLVQGDAVPIPTPTPTPIEDGEEAIFHLPSVFDADTETEAPHAMIMDNEDAAPCTEFISSCNFRDLDRLGRRFPQVELNRTKRKQLQRRSAKCDADAPIMEEQLVNSPSRYSQYMPTFFDSSDILILTSPKKGQMKRHPDEQRQLLRLLLDD